MVMGGVQNVSCDLGGEGTCCRARPPKPGGGGGERYCRVCLRKWDWSGLCTFPLRKMTGREQTGGLETYHRWGGPKPFLGRGSMVRFSFPMPFFASILFSRRGKSATDLSNSMKFFEVRPWGTFFYVRPVCDLQIFTRDSTTDPLRHSMRTQRIPQQTTKTPTKLPTKTPLRRPPRRPLPSPPVRCPFKTGRLRWGDGLTGVSVGVLVCVVVGTIVGLL